jgi:hypothetical protein
MATRTVAPTRKISSGSEVMKPISTEPGRCRRPERHRAREHRGGAQDERREYVQEQ